MAMVPGGHMGLGTEKTRRGACGLTAGVDRQTPFGVDCCGLRPLPEGRQQTRRLPLSGTAQTYSHASLDHLLRQGPVQPSRACTAPPPDSFPHGPSPGAHRPGRGELLPGRRGFVRASEAGSPSLTDPHAAAMIHGSYRSTAEVQLRFRFGGRSRAKLTASTDIGLRCTHLNPCKSFKSIRHFWRDQGEVGVIVSVEVRYVAGDNFPWQKDLKEITRWCRLALSDV